MSVAGVPFSWLHLEINHEWDIHASPLPIRWKAGGRLTAKLINKNAGHTIGGANGVRTTEPKIAMIYAYNLLAIDNGLPNRRITRNVNKHDLCSIPKQSCTNRPGRA